LSDFLGKVILLSFAENCENDTWQAGGVLDVQQVELCLEYPNGFGKGCRWCEVISTNTNTVLILDDHAVNLLWYHFSLLVVGFDSITLTLNSPTTENFVVVSPLNTPPLLSLKSEIYIISRDIAPETRVFSFVDRVRLDQKATGPIRHFEAGFSISREIEGNLPIGSHNLLILFSTTDVADRFIGFGVYSVARADMILFTSNGLVAMITYASILCSVNSHFNSPCVK
jgi:hypothetical protein